jgi:hypothetical protein
MALLTFGAASINKCRDPEREKFSVHARSRADRRGSICIRPEGMDITDPNIRKVTAAVSLPEDLRDDLRYAREGVTVSALLRWGAMLALEALAIELPPSVARFRRAFLGGQARWGCDETDPDFAILHFSDPAVYEALVRRAARGNGDIGRAAYEFVVAGIKHEAELEGNARREVN